MASDYRAGPKVWPGGCSSWCPPAEPSGRQLGCCPCEERGSEEPAAACGTELRRGTCSAPGSGHHFAPCSCVFSSEQGFYRTDTTYRYLFQSSVRKALFRVLFACQISISSLCYVLGEKAKLAITASVSNDLQSFCYSAFLFSPLLSATIKKEKEKLLGKKNKSLYYNRASRVLLSKLHPGSQASAPSRTQPHSSFGTAPQQQRETNHIIIKHILSS